MLSASSRLLGLLLILCNQAKQDNCMDVHGRYSHEEGGAAVVHSADFVCLVQDILMRKLSCAEETYVGAMTSTSASRAVPVAEMSMLLRLCAASEEEVLTEAHTKLWKLVLALWKYIGSKSVPVVGLYHNIDRDRRGHLSLPEVDHLLRVGGVPPACACSSSSLMRSSLCQWPNGGCMQQTSCTVELSRAREIREGSVESIVMNC